MTNLSNYYETMSRFLFLLIYFHHVSDCSYADIRSLIPDRGSGYIRNYRFGMFEDQMKTTEITREELLITAKLRQLQKLIRMKGKHYMLRHIQILCTFLISFKFQYTY